MSTALVALFVSLGGSTWVYTKLQNKTGYGNNRSAIIGAAMVFVVAFIVVFSVGHSLMK